MAFARINMARLLRIAKHFFKYIKVKYRNITKQSDHKRWQQASSLHENWNNRTKLISQLIRPESRVIEFGAGRMILKSALPSNCTYTPSDLVLRTPDTLLVDLNGELPRLTSQYDYAVFSGVLEYVFDIEKVVQWLRPQSKTVIASYSSTGKPYSRTQNGWVNNLTDSEFCAIFARSGFICRNQIPWEDQRIFVFERT